MFHIRGVYLFFQVWKLILELQGSAWHWSSCQYVPTSRRTWLALRAWSRKPLRAALRWSFFQSAPTRPMELVSLAMRMKHACMLIALLINLLDIATLGTLATSVDHSEGPVCKILDISGCWLPISVHIESVRLALINIFFGFSQSISESTLKQCQVVSLARLFPRWRVIAACIWWVGPSRNRRGRNCTIPPQFGHRMEQWSPNTAKWVLQVSWQV